MITNSINIPQAWKSNLDNETKKEYYMDLMDFIEGEYANNTVFPSAENVMNALEYTELDNVKVVILGQDPYHDENQAHGLSFSVPLSQKKIPPSLKNIYKELESDIGFVIPTHGNLEKWARQGVLLLNTVLTVRAHDANSHKGRGWEIFTDKIIKVLNEQDRPIVFMLWGGPSQKKGDILNNPKHLVLKAPHPSPLSVYRGFWDCKHFSKANAFLVENGLDKIDWSL